MNDTSKQEPLVQEDAARGPVRFRIIHIVYVITLIASALATFGPGGIVPGVLISAFWAYIFLSRSRPSALATAVAVVLVVFFLLCLGLPAVRTAREASRRMQCVNNIKQIALALHNYHDVYGCLPPAFVTDETGRPMHSWRVLVLPYLEQQPLYDQYDFSEPWDGPNNRKLIQQIPQVYRCPSSPSSGNAAGIASYVAVVGPDTAWPGATSRTLGEIRDQDGTSNTMLVLEADGLGIAWTEPRDLEYAAALKMLSEEAWVQAGGHTSQDFFYTYATGRHMAMADGRSQSAWNGVTPDVWAALLTINDGQQFDEDLLNHLLVKKRPRLGNWIRLGVFLVLVFYPLPWVWWSPKRSVQIKNG